jgi:guanine nucleotide-binding protein G(i) subunit alpha
MTDARQALSYPLIPVLNCDTLCLELSTHMGIYISKPSRVTFANVLSQAIDQQIEVDARRFRRECKILLLGSIGSGKSTIVKQMKLIHGLTVEERKEYTQIIHSNVLDSIHTIITMLRKHQLDAELEDENRSLVDIIMESRAPIHPGLTEGVARAIDKFWTDPIVAKLLKEQGTEFYLLDSAC